MCSSKEPIILRLTKNIDIQNFTVTKFENELKKHTPLLHSVLMAASVRRSTEDLFWISSVYVAAAVCLKNRCPGMTAMQLLNTIFIQHSGLIVRCISITGLSNDRGHICKFLIIMVRE